MHAELSHRQFFLSRGTAGKEQYCYNLFDSERETELSMPRMKCRFQRDINQSSAIVYLKCFVEPIYIELLLQKRQCVKSVEPPVLFVELLNGSRLLRFKVLFLQPSITKVLQDPKRVKEGEPVFDPFSFKCSVLLVVFQRQALLPNGMTPKAHVQLVLELEGPRAFDLELLFYVQELNLILI